MGNALDIDLYKNGFDYRHVDCVQAPVAAASGYFNHDNYFYYSFLHSILGNTENYYTEDIVDYSNKILCRMGLKIEKIDCTGFSSKEAMAKIAEEILAGRPVILVVKYNSLFYNMYYKNREFRLIHGMLINEVNEVNKTFGIKEPFLFGDSLDAYENKNAFFPLHITFDMLKNIWEDSNDQFHSEKRPYADSIYSMYPTEEVSLDLNKVINIAMSFTNDYESDLIHIINTFEATSEFHDYIVFNRLRFYGCLQPIFHLLHRQSMQISPESDAVNNIEKIVGETRSKVISALDRASVRCQEISPKRKADLCRMVSEGDEELFSLIKSLAVKEEKTDLHYFFIDISKYYNNQAFEESLKDDSVADITGEGTHYIFRDVVVNKEWKKGEYCFNYSYSSGQYDNISCSGQEICIPNIQSKFISILGCSEFGSYNEDIEIEYSDGSRKVITADFSDFFQPPVFGEKAYWTGEAAERKKGKTRYHSFNARLFAKRYPIDSGCVAKLILPKRRNVHIFALTLTDEVLL